MGAMGVMGAMGAMGATVMLLTGDLVGVTEAEGPGMEQVNIVGMIHMQNVRTLSLPKPASLHWLVKSF
jgi:hypothetical protein